MTIRATKIPGSGDDVEISPAAALRMEKALSAIGWMSRMPKQYNIDMPYTCGLLVGPPEWLGDEEFFPVSLFTMPEGPEQEGHVSILFYVPSADMTDDELDAILIASQDITTMAVQALTLSFGDDDKEVDESDDA